jgi:ribosomal protein S18 acetylase RimI-like enzyme
VTAEIRVLGRGDEKVLATIAPGVFDRDVKEQWISEFLGDPRHHLAVAIDAGVVVGFASAVHYVNPDKPPELWINEIGVAPTHRNQGLGKKLLRALFAVGQRAGCSEAWVLTDRSNAPAIRLYTSVGGTEVPKDEVMFMFRPIPSQPGGNP